MSVTVTVRSRVPAYTAKSLVAVGLAVRKATLDVEALAKARAPVDTGFLRSSINSDVSATEGKVVAGAAYAVFVELGTHKMGAQPYMIPSLEQVVPSFEAALRAALT